LAMPGETVIARIASLEPDCLAVPPPERTL
jgi:hypothetical protein